MQSWQSSHKKASHSRIKGGAKESSLAFTCLQIVDACLLGILVITPLFFGGRHLLGRFIFILLTSVAAVAWFTRQALLNQSKWTRSWAHVLGLAAIFLVALQVVPLPTQWLEQLATRNTSLLSLWNSETSNPTQLGTWNTLSLTPSSTKIALATLVAYVLLFMTVVGRLQKIADIKRMILAIALAAMLMSVFGILQYFTSNGLFFWFYQHPHTTTSSAVKGSFTTSNHFAHYIALGVGPLLAWIVLQLRSKESSREHRRSRNKSSMGAASIALHVGLGIIGLAVLLSFSRGGAVVLALASSIAILIYFRRGLLSGTYLYGLALLGLLVVGALSISGYEQVAGRLDDFTSASLEELDNQQGRRKIWAANVAAIREGSFFGSGAGSHREIYPIYLPKSSVYEYTHAENGYLQVATENGFLGIALLGLTIIMVGNWCWQALQNASSESELALAGAVIASLAISVIHSLVDFVWFIPACMSLTILLAACALRLAQLTKNASGRTNLSLASFGKIGWSSLTIIASCASLWAITTSIGPARASLHWDGYLRSATLNRRQAFSQLVANVSRPNQQAGCEAMIYHLQYVVSHDPHDARAHLRLAGKYLQLFNQRQQASSNAMSVEQIRDAALASQFASSQALRQWLTRAFGENSRLLYQAHYHATKSLRLCPLQGQGYLYLADLCFLEGSTKEPIEHYLQQIRQVRPYEGRVLFEVGRQQLLLGQATEAIELWKQIYRDNGLHQLKIINLFAGPMSPELFTETFEPDWQTLPYVWKRFQKQNNVSDYQAFLKYATAAAERECPQKTSQQATKIWYTLATMQAILAYNQDAYTSIKKAYRLSPYSYKVRHILGQVLLRTKQYQQAESHLRWCLARQPQNTLLRKEIAQATEGHLANTVRATTELQYK